LNVVDAVTYKGYEDQSLFGFSHKVSPGSKFYSQMKISKLLEICRDLLIKHENLVQIGSSLKPVQSSPWETGLNLTD
jgi:hypothetical protein